MALLHPRGPGIPGLPPTQPGLSPFDLLVRVFCLPDLSGFFLFGGAGKLRLVVFRSHLLDSICPIDRSLTGPNQRPWCTVRAAKGPSWTVSS